MQSVLCEKPVENCVEDKCPRRNKFCSIPIMKLEKMGFSNIGKQVWTIPTLQVIY